MWLSIMSNELALRLQEEREACSFIYPRTVILRYILSDALNARSLQTSFGNFSNDELATEIHKRAIKLWRQNLASFIEQGRGIKNLSLSFSGLERQSREQKQLDAFFDRSRSIPSKRTATDRVACASAQHSKVGKAKPLFSNPFHVEFKRTSGLHRNCNSSVDHIPSSCLSVLHPSYHLQRDSDTQADMACWKCSRCDHEAKVPVYEDSDDDEQTGRTYEKLLEQLRTEHVHWHMALDLINSE